MGVILTGHGLRACSEAVRPLFASQGTSMPLLATHAVRDGTQEKAPDCFGAFIIPVEGGVAEMPRYCP